MRRRSSLVTAGGIALCLVLLIVFPPAGQQLHNGPNEQEKPITPPYETKPTSPDRSSFKLIEPVATTDSTITPPVDTVSSPPEAKPVSKPFTIEPMVVFEEPEQPMHAEKQPPDVTAPQPGATDSPSTGKRPRVAIIIDDMGYHALLGEKLLALPLNLTFSFLPNAPFTTSQAAAAIGLGREVLVHLPMEPRSTNWYPDQNALFVKDSALDIRRKTLVMLAAIPQATGANNHMGSRLTEDEEAMEVVTQTLKERNLFFIDSFTSARSIGSTMAERFGVPTARREIFLDNVQESRQICRRLEELTAIAQRKGSAIGIGHPYAATLQALIECEAQMLETVDLVNAGQLVQ